MRSDALPSSGPGLLRRIQDRLLVNEDGCWVWQGADSGEGYGYIHLALPRRHMAHVHRLVYEQMVGPIPDGLHIDHLCRNRMCANPAHLEVVTPRENTLRSPVAPAAVNARKTHCLRGHPLSGDNLYVLGRRRICKTCRRIAGNAYNYRRPERQGASV